MSRGSSQRERLRRLTREAASAQAEMTTSLRQRPADRPEPGDLFVARATADLPVEWLILEHQVEDRRAEDSGRVLVIPADTSSLVGSGDVAVPSTAARGALTLRCRFAARCAAETFESDLRTGVLEPEYVERARVVHQAVIAGETLGSVDQREVDLETEYLDGLADAPQPALAALEALERDRAAVVSDPPGEPAPVVELRPRGRRFWVERSLALAASILLVVSLGLGRQVMRSGQEHRAATEAHDQQLEQLARERQGLEAAHGANLAELVARQEESEQEYRRRLAELEGSRRPRAMLNLPFVVLSAARTRSLAENRLAEDGPAENSLAETVELPTEASHLMLILQLQPAELYPKYRLEVRRSGSPRTIWSSDELKTDDLELTAALPREIIGAGDFQLRLSGLLEGERKLLQDYSLTVEVE